MSATSTSATCLASDPNLLTSQIYAEGFGEGAYSRIDTRFYQGLNDSIIDSKLPLVLPRYQYSYFGQPDALGRPLSARYAAVQRDAHGRHQHAARRPDGELGPAVAGALGDLWKIKLHGDAAAYDANEFNEQPNFATVSARQRRARAAAGGGGFPLAVRARLGRLGHPVDRADGRDHRRAARAATARLNKYPNEDSLDLEFTDANLFGFNRFAGIDRLEGGVARQCRAARRLVPGRHHVRWAGRAILPTPRPPVSPSYSGLHDQVSDIVARA